MMSASNRRVSWSLTMHAALVAVKIDPDKADASQAALESEVVPMVKAAPGFIAGYWMEPVDGNAYAVVLFDTEEHARATAPPEGTSPAPGVTIVRTEFRGVVAHA
jgi:hypothetical protein